MKAGDALPIPDIGLPGSWGGVLRISDRTNA